MIVDVAVDLQYVQEPLLTLVLAGGRMVISLFWLLNFAVPRGALSDVEFLRGADRIQVLSFWLIPFNRRL